MPDGLGPPTCTSSSCTPSLAIELESRATGDAKRLVGKFDIVLARP